MTDPSPDMLRMAREIADSDDLVAMAQAFQAVYQRGLEDAAQKVETLFKDYTWCRQVAAAIRNTP